MPQYTAPPYVIEYPGDDETIELSDIEQMVLTIRTALGQAVQDAEDATIIPADVQAIIDQLYRPDSATDLAWDIGDGANSVFTITHNLGTRTFATFAYDTTGTLEDVGVQVRRPTLNTVQLRFGSYVPAAGQVRFGIIPAGVVNTTQQGAVSKEYVDQRINDLATSKALNASLANAFLFGL